MLRGARLLQLETALLFQRALTVALGGCNACFFLAYARRHPRRRLGAGALALVNLALLSESVAFGLLPGLAETHSFVAAAHLAAASLSLAAAASMAALVLRHRLRRRR
ncbi:MAG: hypothetical protein HY532_02990 [Chloroflexi bacterium]|nr:hypothetical protein [Chloroflexota bacterium]